MAGKQTSSLHLENGMPMWADYIHIKPERAGKIILDIKEQSLAQLLGSHISFRWALYAGKQRLCGSFKRGLPDTALAAKAA